MITMYKEPVPGTILEALEIDYPQPTRILVKPDGKFFDIIDYDFTPTKNEVSQRPIEDIDELFEIPF